MVEPVSIGIGLLIAGFAKFGDKLVDLSIKLRNEIRAKRVRRNNIASQYFDDLANALSKVVAGLRANQIPRIDGNWLQGLLRTFDEKTRGVTSLDSPESLRRSLEGALDIAKELDGWLLLNIPSTPQDREQMLAVVERIAGACAALASVLKDEA